MVLSHWREGICVASTPVDVTELPALIGVLVDALGDAAATPPSPAMTPTRRSLWSRVKGRLRPTTGEIVELEV